MIAIAGWRIWEAPSSEMRTWCLIAYTVQLALNAAWSPVFFGSHKLFGGLVTILALDIAVLATIVTSWQLDRTAALLLIPYLAWTLFATALNASIWRRNERSA
jgi:tryptophan-rich sensory protein